ncbi:MAG TPA: hypothetical protein PKK26_05025 [Candidatus Wallbacteria bacterium]|nr:hypothetical protein [Candidatus Wallbacteria bacterium]
MLDKYMTQIKYIAAISILAMMFFGGCTGASNITHEAAGIIIPNVSPSVVMLTSGETDETEIVKNGKFPSLAITFQNLGAIPVTLKNYKVEYVDSYTGEKIGALSFGVEMTYTIDGNPATASTATSSSTTSSTATTTSTTTSGANATASGNTFPIQVVNSKVKVEMYKDTANSTDNRMLTAKITFYGIDYNGNGLQLDASASILP